MLSGKMSTVRNRVGRMCRRKDDEDGRKMNNTAEVLVRIGALRNVTLF
jgi:hypothetical protein